MEKLLYGVANNGFAEVRRYRVRRENRWCYILDTKHRDMIFKSRMRTTHEYFFLNEQDAQKALMNIRLRNDLPLLDGVIVRNGERIYYN